MAPVQDVIRDSSAETVKSSLLCAVLPNSTVIRNATSAFGVGCFEKCAPDTWLDRA
jgi:hypothetical protein